MRTAGAPAAGACHSCGRAIDATGRIGRRECCAGCGAELRCCRNCRFYAPAAHNQCREPQAERQVEKERANFCEYFAPGAAAAAADDAGAVARARLAALFGGKRS